ncbi:MAG: DUF362 domain-containing protein [bacterium]
MKTIDQRPKVFFIPWSQKDRLKDLLGLSRAAEAIHEGDFVAVKMHFGERGTDGYIRPEYVKPVIEMIRAANARPFLTDTNTVYSGPRRDAVGHLEVAAEHGFTQEAMGVPILISDGVRGTDFVEVPVKGRHFKRVKIASGICDADSMIVLSHVKGHLLAGFGGALKNLGMGCGARTGKFEMHSSLSPEVDLEKCEGCGTCVATCGQKAIQIVEGHAVIDSSLCAGCGECIVECPYGAIGVQWSEGAQGVQERFVEYATGAMAGRRAFFINFINHVSPNCDCMSRGETPMVPDIGILASADPVAIDQASYDLVFKAGGDVFEKAHPGIDCTIQLAYAEKMGLGRRSYELVGI